MQKCLLLPLLTLILLLTCAVSTQLQPFVLKNLGAVDGSFGIRPMSHKCAGLHLNGTAIDWLPAGDVHFRAGLFSFRYWVDAEVQPTRLYCIGQDIWFGE
jgi:hypothetical protein